jgi:inorganic pyrophosphatase
MNKLVNIYIEIEQHSNQKYEFDKEKNKLILDRVLNYPYFYPYSYGFIPGTMADDNDELDALIITDNKIKNDNNYNAYIIGSLIMEDEKGMDEKILCVLEEDYLTINDMDKLSNNVKENIYWFFSNYKNNTKGKWSKVIGFSNKEESIKLYEKYKLAMV